MLTIFICKDKLSYPGDKMNNKPDVATNEMIDFSSVYEDFKSYLETSGKTIYTVDNNDVNSYKEYLLTKNSPTVTSEKLLAIRDFYQDMSKRSKKTNLWRYLGIIVLQGISIVTSSFWIVPKYEWPTFLWLDKISAALFGTKQIFYWPGFIGSLIGIALLLVLVARGWLEKPKNVLSWIVLILNWWILAVLYGLVIGSERDFFSGSITSYIMIASLTAMLLGFKQIMGFGFLAVIVVAGFNITSVSSRLGPFVFPYLVSLALAIYAQNPEIFDTVLRWIGRQFDSGKAQQVGKEVAQSITKATADISDMAQVAAGKKIGITKSKFID